MVPAHTPVSRLPSWFVILLGVGLTGCGTPAVESGQNHALLSDFKKLEDNIQRELDRVLSAAGLARWSEADQQATAARYQHVATGWKGAGPGTQSVILFVDRDTRRLAVFVEVRDERGQPVVAQQQELEQLVGDRITFEKIRFERESPGSLVDEQRDRIPSTTR